MLFDQVFGVSRADEIKEESVVTVGSLVVDFGDRCNDAMLSNLQFLQVSQLWGRVLTGCNQICFIFSGVFFMSL